MNRERVSRRGAWLLWFVLMLQACSPVNMPRPGIYVAPISEGAPRWIGDGPGVPMWSPTERTVAWGNEDGLFAASADGGDFRRLADRPVVGRPAWSPDGARLAFVDPKAGRLVVLNVDSGSIQFEIPLQIGEDDDTPFAVPSLGGPAWSPDGARIAFDCWDGVGDQLCLVEEEGSNRTQVTQIHRETAGRSSSAIATSNTGPAAWSPAGTYLAAAIYAEVKGAVAGIYIIDLAAGKARRIAESVPGSEISWLPNGQGVLLATTKSGRSDVIEVSLDDGSSRNLSDELKGGARDPALSKDGSTLAVVNGTEIILMSIDDGMINRLRTGLRERHPAWSPDGAEIAFAADVDPIAAYDP